MKKALKVISIVGLLIWTVWFLGGMYFASDGSFLVTIPATLFVGVILFVSFLLMLKMQDKNITQANRDRAKTTSIIMLCIYVIASLFSSYYINHLIRTFDYKNEIQKTVSSAVEELKVTFSESELPNSYRAWVSEEKDRYKYHLETHPEKLGANSLDKEVLSFEETLISEDYLGLEYLVNYITSQIEASVVDAWYLPTLLIRLKELEQKTWWEEQAVNYSKAHDYTKDTPFDPVSTIDCYNLSAPLTQSDFKVSGPSIIIMVVLQIIIFLSFLFSIKTGGKRDKIVTNDHSSIRSWSGSNK